jgi:glucarate dehydratase
MKITALRATPANIPYRTSALMSAGSNDSSTRTIIEMETDTGVTGLGEASYSHAAQIIERDFAPALIGLDPRLGATALRRYCLPDHLDFGTPLLKVRLAAWGGVDIALWDILAQAAGVPLYQLLGGARRERAEFVAYAYSSPDASCAPTQMAAIAKAAVATTGSRIFEFKLGVHPVEVDIATVKAVHEALAGAARLAIDANMGWSYRDAHRLLSEVAPLLENAEEPVASLEQMQQLAGEFAVNVSAHCSDLDTVLAYPRLGVVPTLDATGGITGVRRLARVLGARSRRVWLRSHAEAGIGWAAITHLGMSMPELNRPAQSLMDLIDEDLIVGERWDVLNGGVRPPSTPGLGVSLDRAALRACHALYLEQGEVIAFPPAVRRGADQPKSCA